MTRIAINGLGRIGKLALRAFLSDGAGGDIVLINDAAGDAATHAHLLEFDSVHGRWDGGVAVEDGALIVDGRRIAVTNAARIEDLPLSDMGVDLVIDCTGAFKTEAALASYFAAGVRKVVVSAPVADGGALNLVYGINEDLYNVEKHHIVTAASCTTNCLAPVVKVIHDAFGIKHGSITTIHNITNTQTIVDRPHKDLRRARSGLNALIPTTTGSAKAIAMIFPDLKGRLNGHAVRVPLLNGSLTDCVFELERATDADEINAAFRAAADGPLKGILGFEARPLVSTDFTNDPRSAIIDGPSTMVVNGTQAKIYAWYDNEYGYAQRLTDVTRMVAASLA